MKKNYNRIQRVAEVIQTALAEIILRHGEELQIGLLSVTDVEVSHDMSFAKVFVSVLEENKAKETLNILNEAAKELRYELAQSTKLRITPELKFVYDDSSVRGNRISSLINDVFKKTTNSSDEA